MDGEVRLMCQNASVKTAQRTSDNSDFALEALRVRVSGNLLQLWDFFEGALVWDWSDELLGEGCETALGRCGGLWDIWHVGLGIW